MKYIIVTCCSLMVTNINAQIVTDTLGSVMLTYDVRLDKVKLKQAVVNIDKSAPKKDLRGNYLPVLVNGFRLQVLTTTDRNVANQMKAKLYGLFPDEKAYILNKAPYYSVLQGDYFINEDAKKAKRYAEKQLGIVVYIVNARLLALPPEASKTIAPKPIIKK